MAPHPRCRSRARLEASIPPGRSSTSLRCVCPHRHVLYTHLTLAHTSLSVQKSHLLCVVPEHPSFDGTHNFTVEVVVYMVSAVENKPGSGGRGFGTVTPPENIVDGYVYTPLPIVANVLTANRSAAARRVLTEHTPPRYGLTLLQDAIHVTATPAHPIPRKLASVANDVITFTTLFTYTSGAVCGCDANPGSTCDACGM